ncbi:glutathione S-transferase N-terminal domain-containing protein, partial [Candidatus Woesearchaeota archaeon]|nr:glutathione S-transferase N-terminal domain-containing protein [Candidatus Woesearchaeota archaeon]
CPWCVRAKQYLKEKNVKFEDKNVATDHDARHEMVEKSGQLGVPVLVINGNVIVGFNQTAIEKALG